MLRLTLALLLCHLATAPCRADEAPSIAKLVDKIIAARNSDDFETDDNVYDTVERRVAKSKNARLELLPLMQHKNSDVRSLAMNLWIGAGAEPSAVELVLDDEDERNAFHAACFLLDSNTSIEKSLKTLLRLERSYLTNPGSPGTNFSKIFENFSPSLTKRAIPILTAAMNDQDVQLRRAATICLETLPLGPDDFTISQLVPLTQNARNRVRIRALQILASIETDSPEVLAAATRNLSHQDAKISLTSAEIIGRIAPERADYRQTILRRLKSPTSRDRELALKALKAVGIARDDIVPTIIDSLHKQDQDDFDSLAYFAYRIFESIGPDAVRDLLTAAQHDTNARVRRFAVRMLGVIGPASQRDVLPVLMHSLGSDDPAMKRDAIDAIAKLGARAAPAVPKLTAILAHDRDLRDAALAALDQLRPLPKPTLALVESLMNDADTGRRYRAAEVLIHNKVPSEKMLSLLLPLVSDETPDDCLDALELIAKMGPAAKPAIPTLIDALALKEAVGPGCTGDSIVQRVPSTLAAVGPETVPPLIQALESRNPQVRGLAAQTLGEIGPAAAPATHALLGRLHDGERFETSRGILIWESTVAELAVEALAKIGPDADSALPQLTELANEELARDEIPEGFSPLGTFLQNVIAAIASIGRDDPETIAYLRATLHHPRVENSPYGLDRDILAALVKMKPDAGTIADFERLLTAPNSSLNYELGRGKAHDIIDALIRLGDRANKLKPQLRFLLNKLPLLDPEVRCELAYALYRLDPNKREGLDYLRAAAALNRRSPYTIIFARDRLEELGLLNP